METRGRPRTYARPKSGLAFRLWRARVKSGKTQAEVAAEIGCARAAIGHYEGGIRVPDEETVRRLAKALRVSVKHLSRSGGKQAGRAARA